MKNLEKEMGGGREETWGKRILNGLIGFDLYPHTKI